MGGGGVCVKKQAPTCTVNRLSTKALQLLAGEREVLPTDVPDQVGLSGERMTLALPHTANKNRPRRTTGPNAKAKTTKLPEGNIESLYKFGIGKNFLDRMWKAGTVNKILVKWTSATLESPSINRHYRGNRVKTQAGESMCSARI